MPPIRLGLIGLSQTSTTSWASQAHIPYLLSPRGRERYQIVALLNSSAASAQAAIAAYGLDTTTTRAYGRPEELAADERVDLVACVTRVDKHYDSVVPSLRAGKDVFVEWPLAENATRARELAELARRTPASQTAVGVQGRLSPAVRKVKELLEEGAVGKVLSSDLRSYAVGAEREGVSEGLAYFLDKKVGGNPLTIAFGHTIDLVHSVLGEFEKPGPDAQHVQIRWPNQTVRHSDGSTSQVQADVPDLLTVAGTLVESKHVAAGATLTATFRKGPPFPGEWPLNWTIVGEKGAIRLSSAKGTTIQANAALTPIPIELHDFATDEVRQISWTYDDWQEDLMNAGVLIAKLYDSWYEGKRSEADGICDFNGAVRRHEEVDSFLYTSNRS